MAKYFSSDWHLGHKKIIEFSDRPFENLDIMNEYIIAKMLEPLKSGDEFYFLGDMCFQEGFAEMFIKRLQRGIKFFWIVGNHDKKVPYHIQANLYKHMVVRDIYETKIGKKDVVLCHFPLAIWNKSHWNSWHLHGHLHNNQPNRELIQKGKMLNVNCEFHDYKPWSEQEIIDWMDGQPDNFDREPKE